MASIINMRRIKHEKKMAQLAEYKVPKTNRAEIDYSIPSIYNSGPMYNISTLIIEPYKESMRGMIEKIAKDS